MKTSKHGFTLVELLATIIVLGVISLIATPIVLNVIEESEKSSIERSTENYIRAVETAAAVERMEGNPLEGEYTILENGNLCPAEQTCTDKTDIEIEADRNRPSSGTVYISRDLVTKESMVTMGEYQVNYNDEGKLVASKMGATKTPATFAEDDWSTIAANVKAGNLSAYKVGDEKEIVLEGFGAYTVRIANTSTPDECNTAGFSQTACGFVIEFVDIITQHFMNSTHTNVGGWKDSAMRIYLNDVIFNSLPLDLSNNIIETMVVSNNGKSGGGINLTTTDKLFLLSMKEVWNSSDSASTVVLDTSEIKTRQLDYYQLKKVTGYSTVAAKKQYNGIYNKWLLRSAYYNSNAHFACVTSAGEWMNYEGAGSSNGVSPAFRLG